MQRHEVDAVALHDLRKAFEQLAGDHAHVGARLLDGHARLEPPDGLQPESAARLLELWPGGERHPHVCLFLREGEARGHDADDCAVYAVEADRLPDDVRVTAEAPLPQAVADDGDEVAARLLFFTGEGPA